jgi:hypothetical protein
MGNNIIHRFRIQPNGHSRCPSCDMLMIVSAGFGLAPECKTFECVHCGRVEGPATSGARLEQAAS